MVEMVGLLALVGVVLWAVLRTNRIARLRSEVHRPLGGADAGAVTATADSDQRPLSVSLVDAGASSGASAAGVVWQWARIDPQVVSAVDFASAADIDSGFGLAMWVQETYGSVDAISEGAQTRLVGHVGELLAAERLTDAGHAVIWADTPNNPAWDLLVDGVQVNVKTVAHVGHVDVAHDDVTYLVPEDASGTTAADNVERLEGFFHADAKESLKEALADTTAGPAQAFPVPVVAIAVAARREARAVRLGKDVPAAVEHGAVDAVIKGSSATAGGSLGAAVGAPGGPLGAAVGIVVGAGAGALAARPLVGHVKGRRLRRANAALAEELTAYGQPWQDELDELQRWVQWHREQADAALSALTEQAVRIRRTLRWKLWPTYAQVATVEAATLGQQRRDEVARRVANAEALLRSAHTGATPELGAMLLAVPDLLDRLGDRDPEALARIEEARQRAERERRNLAGPDSQQA